ncbi:UNVERIFIED_CONTAM: hypothetical protein FKN15_003082 [Acipenser sinensis]
MKKGALSRTRASAAARFNTSRQVTERRATRHSTVHTTNKLPGKPRTNAKPRKRVPTISEEPREEEEGGREVREGKGEEEMFMV